MRLIAAAILAFLIGCAQGPDAAEAVRPLYADDAAPTLSEVPWTGEMADLVEQAEALQSQGEALISVNPVFASQDGEPGRVEFQTARRGDDRAIVTVRFDVLGEAREVHYDLAKEAGAWRIGNIRSTEAGDLRELLLAGVAASRAEIACTAEIGAEEAAKLVAQCIQVSPATRPPCHPDNSCGLIRDEIARGCAMLEGAGAPDFCAAADTP